MRRPNPQEQGLNIVTDMYISLPANAFATRDAFCFPDQCDHRAAAAATAPQGSGARPRSVLVFRKRVVFPKA